MATEDKKIPGNLIDTTDTDFLDSLIQNIEKRKVETGLKIDDNLTYYSVSEVAKIIKKGPSTVKTYIQNHINEIEGSVKLAAVKIGKSYSIPKSSVEDYFKHNTKK